MKRFILLTLTLSAVAWLAGPSALTAADAPAAASKPAATASAEPVQLRLRLEKGKTYQINMTTVQKVDQEVMGMKMSLSQTIGMGIDFKVTEVDGQGIQTATITYSSIRFKLTGAPTGNIDYDSTKPPEKVPDMAKGFAAIVGLPMGIKMDSLGTMKEITNLKAFRENLIKNMGLPDGPQKDMMVKMMDTQFGEKNIKHILGQMTCIYPEKSLAVGDQWKKSMAMNSPFPILYDMTYQLLKSTPDGASVSMKSVITANPDPKAQPKPMAGMQQTLKLSGTQTGTLDINRKTGWIKTGTIKQNMTGTITISGAQNMTVPLTIKSDTKLKGNLKT